MEIKSFLVTSRQISFTFCSLHVLSRVTSHLDSTGICSILRSGSHVMIVNICTFCGPGELMCLCRELIQHQKLSFTSTTNQICREKNSKKKKKAKNSRLFTIRYKESVLWMYYWKYLSALFFNFFYRREEWINGRRRKNSWKNTWVLIIKNNFFCFIIFFYSK